jgi:hypothetical protein
MPSLQTGLLAPLKRVSGVNDVNVNFGLQSLSLDEGRTTGRTTEEKIKALGYAPVAGLRQRATM